MSLDSREYVKEEISNLAEVVLDEGMWCSFE